MVCWNSQVSDRSDLKLLHLIPISDLETSAAQFSTNYIPDWWGDVLDITVHQNIQLSEATFLDFTSKPCVTHWIMLELKITATE